MEQLLLVSIVISLFCVGLRIISAPNMILNFLRQPYTKSVNRRKTLSNLIMTQEHAVESVQNTLDGVPEQQSDELIRAKLINELHGLEDTLEEYKKMYSGKIIRLGIIIYILKPIIGCGTCMASFWTFVWWGFLGQEHSLWIVVAMFVIACFNSLIYAVYEKLTK